MQRIATVVDRVCVGKKNASRRQSKKRQRRTVERRRKARSRTAGQARSQGPTFMTLTLGSGGEHEEDDCPHCRAMRELGIRDGVPMTAEQHRAFKARVDQLVTEEGMDGGESVPVDALMARFEWINERLREQGEFVDLDDLHEMSDERFMDHMRKVNDLGDAYDRMN